MCPFGLGAGKQLFAYQEWFCCLKHYVLAKEVCHRVAHRQTESSPKVTEGYSLNTDACDIGYTMDNVSDLQFIVPPSVLS